MCPPPPGTSSLSIAQGQAAQNSGQGEQYVSDCKFKGYSDTHPFERHSTVMIHYALI